MINRKNHQKYRTVHDRMTSPFCEKCGVLLTLKQPLEEKKNILWCPNCRKKVEIEDTSYFQEHTSIQHSPQEITRILENGPPPVPKILTQTYVDRRKKRCNHPNAVSKDFISFHEEMRHQGSTGGVLIVLKSSDSRER